MATRPASDGGNRLLNKLPESDRRLLAPHLVREDLPVRKRPRKAEQADRQRLFHRGRHRFRRRISATAMQIEIGIIGREGMTGAAVVLGDDRTPYAPTCRSQAAACAIGAEQPARSHAQSSRCIGIASEFVQAFMLQTSHTAVANARGKIEVRLARWLLMAHDRSPSDGACRSHTNSCR